MGCRNRRLGREPTTQRIVRLMLASRRTVWSVDDVMAVAGLPYRASARSLLVHLCNQGRLERVRRGRYRVVPGTVVEPVGSPAVAAPRIRIPAIRADGVVVSPWWRRGQR